MNGFPFLPMETEKVRNLHRHSSYLVNSSALFVHELDQVSLGRSLMDRV